jgi:hypothetical protein
MTIKVSIGEALDKATILDIKLKMIQDVEKLANINKEFRLIRKSLLENYGIDETNPYYLALLEINVELWGIEDEIRFLDRVGDFGLEFIKLAQSVYKLNDERAAIKKEINIYYNSELTEEKSYKNLL